MSQQALSRDTWTRSYIRQIEVGKVVPPSETLIEIANRLDVTAGELLGHDVLLQAAKETLFTAPKLCRKLLAESPMTTTARVLLGLVEAYETAALPHKPSVYDSELYFLTAKVMMEDGQYEPAAELLNEALRFSHPLWKIRLLGQLLVCYQALQDADGCNSAKEQLRDLLGETSDLEGTICAVYRKGHGRDPIVLKRSLDGGKTWSARLPAPKSWATSREVTTLYHLWPFGGGVLAVVFRFVSDSHGLFPGSRRYLVRIDAPLYRSADQGKTSEQQEFTMAPDSNGHVPSFHMCEHGITLQRGMHTGRLICPARV